MRKLAITLLAVLTGALLAGSRGWADPPSSTDSVHVTLTGEVHAPGPYAVSADSSISSLLAQAGGVTEMAAEMVYIERADESGQLKRYSVDLHDARSAQPHMLQEGDQLLVPRAPVYSITGQVGKPGSYRLDPSLTVMQAVAKAGGETIWAKNRRSFEIARQGADGSRVTVKASPDDFVEPNDVIRVKVKYF